MWKWPTFAMKVAGRSRTCAECYSRTPGMWVRIPCWNGYMPFLCCIALFSVDWSPIQGVLLHTYNRISIFGKWAALGCRGQLHGIMWGIYLYQVKLCFMWYSYINIMIMLTRMYLCIWFSVIIYLWAVTVVGKWANTDYNHIITEIWASFAIMFSI